MRQSRTTRRIGAAAIFEGCRRSQLELIDHLGTEVDVRAGRVLCVDATPGMEFFVLLDGLVEVSTAEGRVAIIHPGGWFGELALLDNGMRRATVAATASSILLVFGRREFTTLLAACPTVATKIRARADVFNAGRLPDQQPWYEPTASMSTDDSSARSEGLEPPTF